MIKKLKFANGNAKLKGIHTFSLPAAWSCPGASLCMSKANRETGKITDGPLTQFRCYAASAEALFPNIRKSRWGNFDLLKACKSLSEMVNLIEISLPKKAKIIRIGASGDFYSQTYFDAWLEVARNNSNLIFYAYTKSIPFVVARINDLPNNFKIVASKGGKWDELIEKHSLKFAEVVFSKQEAKEKGLAVDKTDKLAYTGTKSFGLLLHGTQPAQSEAGKAWQIIKANEGGYSKAAGSYLAHYKKN
jgi:hypothetical protein